jgi:hypothetical protein
MHEARVTSWPVKKFTAMIERELLERGHEADVAVLLEEILERSCLLVIQDEDVRFRHLLIQEFFAGRGIPDADFIQSVIADTWWAKAVVFYFGQNPENHKDLQAVIHKMGEASPQNLYQAAISIGLALQACYLTKLEDKASILRWVLTSLAATKLAMTSGKIVKEGEDPSVMETLFYYMFARDAVAGKAIRVLAEQIIGEQPKDGLTPEAEMQKFWCIAGLIEAGDTERAGEYIKHFNPSDMRLLLCLHLGCYYVWKLRVASPVQKKIAEKICDRLSDRIGHLHKQLLKEMKSMLLEIRSGEIKAIDEVESDGSGSKDGE